MVLTHSITNTPAYGHGLIRLQRQGQPHQQSQLPGSAVYLGLIRFSYDVEDVLQTDILIQTCALIIQPLINDHTYYVTLHRL